MTPCWIITYAKTGSTYLSRLLNSTGLFDPPFREHYREPGVEAPPDAPPPYCKLMHSQYTWHRKHETPLFECYHDMKFVYLRRRDVAAAAVSMYFHNATQCFNLEDPSKLEGYQKIRLKYDGKKMQEAYMRKTWEFHFWDGFARRAGDKCLRLYYEDIIAEPQEQVTKVMQHLGIESWNVNMDDKSLTIKLEHPQKRRFLARLKRQLAGRGLIARPSEPASRRPSGS